MAKKRTITFLLVAIFVLGFVSCGGEESSKTVEIHKFAVAENDFELRGCNWNLRFEKTETVIYEVMEDESYGTPFYPEQGFFYIIPITITPGETPYLNLRDVRYQMVDVHGNIYLPTRIQSATDEYSKQTGLVDLNRANGIINDTVEGFLLIDGAGKLKGITLEIFTTGQTPEEKIAIIDLKQ